jgi:hypothetical protein
MATTALIVEELLTEIGKSSSSVRQKLSNSVGEVVVDILLASDARFRKLQRTQTITVLVDEKSYQLETDFHRIAETFLEIDSTGDLVREWEIVDGAEFYRRLADPDYGGLYYATIETKLSPPGDYLLLAKTPSETTYLKLFYWRKPLSTDTDAITNTTAIKEGVRAKHLEFWPDAPTHLVIYERMKSGIGETLEQVTTGLVIKPDIRRQRLNRLEHKIGAGQ